MSETENIKPPATTDDRLGAAVVFDAWNDKLDDPMRAWLTSYFDNGCSVTKTCEATKVSRSQVTRWKASNEAFRSYFDKEFEDNIYRSAVSNLLKSGNKGSVRASSRLLDHIERVKFGINVTKTGVVVNNTANAGAQAQANSQSGLDLYSDKKEVDRQVVWKQPKDISPDHLRVREDEPK